MPTNSYKVVVAALNSNGEPDFFFCKVRCTPEEYEVGEHFTEAKKQAEAEGYEPGLGYDETVPGWKALGGHFVWDSATEYTV